MATTLTKEDTISMRNKLIGPSCILFFENEPIKIVKGKGQYMYDEMNNRYLDCINNVAHVGHCHEAVVEAGTQQMSTLSTNCRYLNDNITLLAQKLQKTLPPQLCVFYFVNSGSEANDLAIRMARAHTKKNDVMVLNHAYHGNSVTQTQLSPYKFNKPGGIGKADWVHVACNPDMYKGEFNHRNTPSEKEISKLYADGVKRNLFEVEQKGRGVAAFLAESMQSCGGQVTYPENYLSQVYNHIRGAGGVCIADEVQVGFGRLGKHWWAFESQDVIPDMVTMGKPMGNGHPVACLVTTREIANSFKSTGIEYFNTFGGNPVSCAIALSVLETIEKDKLMENAVKIGDYLLKEFNVLKDRYQLIGDVRGLGMFLGIELVKNRETREPATEEAKYIITRLKQQFVIYSTDGPDSNVLKFKPPMCLNIDDAREIVDKIGKSLEEIESDPDVLDMLNNNITHKRRKLVSSLPKKKKVPTATLR